MTKQSDHDKRNEARPHAKEKSEAKLSGTEGERQIEEERVRAEQSRLNLAQTSQEHREKVKREEQAELVRKAADSDRIPVVATRAGFYGNAHRARGEEFFLAKEEDFTETWMRKAKRAETNREEEDPFPHVPKLTADPDVDHSRTQTKKEAEPRG